MDAFPKAATIIAPRVVKVQRVLWLIVFLGIVALIGLVMRWAVGLPPTRPRPDSRYRGRTFMSVHRRLRPPRE